MLATEIADDVHAMLFGDPRLNTFAVLDGASIPSLLEELAAQNPPHVCLFRGPLPPDVPPCAPYLVHLHRDAPFTQWLLEEGWGQHWGIFAVALASLRAMRSHFRKFLMVRDPDGKAIYFRYYDPRVMRVYLPTCTPDEAAFVFGPINRFVMEDESPEKALRIKPTAEGPVVKTIG